MTAPVSSIVESMAAAWNAGDAKRVLALATQVSGAEASLFTAVAPDLWLYVLSATFILATLFLPRGLLGLFQTRWGKPASKAAHTARPGEANA